MTRGGQRGQARDFLQALLRGGPRSAREVWEEGQKQGLSERTLRRAKRELAVRSAVAWPNGVRQSYWLLAGQELPAELRGLSDDLEDLLRPLREKYPPRTPLDEE